MSYAALWADKTSAKRLLGVALSRYVDAQLGRSEGLEPVREFALDRHKDAVEQLRLLYEFLLDESPEASHSIIVAASELYELKRRALPPRYFEAAILGAFLLIAAPGEMKPDTEYFLRFFRPLIDSQVPLERGVYFSSLANLYETFASAAEPKPEKLRELLWNEWDYLTGEKSIPVAALSRVLMASNPEMWPMVLATIGEIHWPRDRLEAAKPAAFAQSIQNMMSGISPEIFAANYWKIDEYFRNCPLRADVTALALFGDDSKDDSSNNLAPYRLIAPLKYESWFWDYRIAGRKSPLAGRTFPLDRGEWRAGTFGAYTLTQTLVATLGAPSVAIIMNAA